MDEVEIAILKYVQVWTRETRLCDDKNWVLTY
jgi:hypothetical protein